MLRVTRTNKCPVCGKDSWCLIGKSTVICMRVQSGTQKDFKGGEMGWVHPLDPSKPPVQFKRENRTPTINVGKTLREYQAYAQQDVIKAAALLGVTRHSLWLLECTASKWPDTVAFPMRDGHGNYIGIRIRSHSGNKWAVPGSNSGIFIPLCKPQRRMFVLEGPTDTAAALTLGCYAVGRPSCSGGVPHIIDHIRHTQVQEVVIVSNNDKPDKHGVCVGQRGASMLQEFLPVPSCIVVPPTKDIRQFLSVGGTKKMLDEMVASVTWVAPQQPAQPAASSSC